MSIVKQEPVNRTTITIIVVALLCAAAIAYSQGWFNWSRSSSAAENNTVRTDESVETETTREDAVRLTRETATPTDTVTE